MKTIFSSADIYQRDRFDAWHEAVRRQVLNHHSETWASTEPRATRSAASLNELTGIRYANAVLADEAISLGKLIQTRRLERYRQALGNPTQSHRSISEIAYCWGFSDMTHFGRRFKAAFGVLPSEFRRTSALP